MTNEDPTSRTSCVCDQAQADGPRDYIEGGGGRRIALERGEREIGTATIAEPLAAGSTVSVAIDADGRLVIRSAKS